MSLVDDVTGIWQEVYGFLEQSAADGAEADAIASYVAGVFDTGAVGVVAVGAAAVGLPEIIVGLATLLLVIAAADLIFKPLGDLLKPLPLVGKGAHDILYSAANTIQSAVGGITDNALHGLYDVISTCYNFVYGIAYAMPHAVNALSGKVNNIATVQIPSQINSLLQIANNDFFAVSNQANAQFDQAEADLHGVQNLLTTYATDIYHQVETDIQTAKQQTEADIQASQALVVQSIHDNIEQVTHFVGDEVAAVELELGGVFTQSENYTDTKVGAVQQELSGSVVPGLAAVTAVATATQNAFQKYLDECGEPICQANKQNSNNLNALGALGGLGGLLAFLAAAVKDPKDTADITYDALSPIVGIAGGALNDLLGAVI